MRSSCRALLSLSDRLLSRVSSQHSKPGPAAACLRWPGGGGGLRAAGDAGAYAPGDDAAAAMMVVEPEPTAQGESDDEELSYWGF